MTELKTTTSNSWSGAQAVAFAAFSLLFGVCCGWLIRRSVGVGVSENPQFTSSAAPGVAPSPPVSTNFSSVPAMPSSEDLKQVADTQAAPLLEQLKADPTNARLLSQLGNIYYDGKEYPTAIDYYQRSLKLQPTDSSVRTDMATAYWFSGNADTAIVEFQKALSYEPDKANALFNLGIVKWKGKNDAAGAIADWQKLLATNPGFQARARVEDLIRQAQGSMEQKR